MADSAQALSLVVPIDITAAKLTDSNIPEPDSTVGEVVYVAGTTYTIGQRVILVSTHTLYESLQNSNVGHSPDVSPTWWVPVSKTNRFRMFDQINNSVSTHATVIDTTITAGEIVNSLALLNLVAQTIRVRMTDPIDGLVFDTTFQMQSPPSAADWWSYYFEPIYNKTDLYTTLPSYGAAAIRVEVNQSGVPASVGVMLLGRSNLIGDGVQYGASLGIQDYSRKERNEFGDLILVERSFSKKASFRMFVPNSQRAAVNRLLTQYRAKPCLWIGIAGEEDTYIYGIYKEFAFIIEFVDNSVLTLDLEGLT